MASFGLNFLQAADFYIGKNKKGDALLCHRIKDFSLVLFYSKNCKICPGVIEIFKRLAGKVSGCHICMTQMNKDIFKMSMGTNTPVEYVPLVILYTNGKPLIRCETEYNEQTLIDFIIDVSERLRKREDTTTYAKPTGNVPYSGDIPVYSFGIPISNKDVFYLTYDDAYGDEE
jgi:hypothetical protein